MSLFAGSTVPFRTPSEVARRTASVRRLAMAVAVTFAVTSVVAFASPSRAFGWDAGSFSSSSEAELVALTNRSRVNAGLPALKRLMRPHLFLLLFLLLRCRPLVLGRFPCRAAI